MESKNDNQKSSSSVKLPMPVVYLTRVEHFSSAHRLFKRNWDADKNKIVFGKCDNVHGHNYKLEVTVKGPVNSETGMVMNIVQLKEIIDHFVMAPLDHRNIDQDVSHFNDHDLVSTSENLALFIWRQIATQLPDGVQMHRVKLHETDKNIVEYYGECDA